MSVGGYEWRFQASLPKTCLFCQYGYPVVFGLDSWLDSFMCGGHIVEKLRGKKVTLKLVKGNPDPANKEPFYCPITAPDDTCEQFKPIKLGGRKFRLLDAFGYFEKGNE